MMFDSKSWTPSFRFISGKDSPASIGNWGCKGKAGVYVIRDRDDTKNLYVGKAEGNTTDIQQRLQSHLSGNGNRGIRKLVLQGETFTVRWAESQNPALSEAIAIIQLAPQFNGRCEWKELVDRTLDDDCLAEAERLGLISDQPFRKIAERIVLLIRQENAERIEKQSEQVRSLWENEQTQPERVLPLWERNIRPEQERKNYRER